MKSIRMDNMIKTWSGYNDSKKALDTVKNSKNLSNVDIEKLETIIAKNPSTISDYADLTKSRFPKGEKNILSVVSNNPEDFHYFIYHNYISKHIGRWPEYEELIVEKKISNNIAEYALLILKSRWKEAENIIFRKLNSSPSDSLKNYISKFYCEEIEEKISKILLNKIESEKYEDYAYNDLIFFLKKIGEWKELEEQLSKPNVSYHNLSVNYCVYGIKKRNDQIEKKLLSMLNDSSLRSMGNNLYSFQNSIYLYCKELVGEWPELEAKLEQKLEQKVSDTVFCDLWARFIIDYTRYCKKSHSSLINKLNIGRTNNYNTQRAYSNYCKSAEKQIENFIKTKQYDKALEYSTINNFAKIIASLERKHIIPDEIKNFMMANHLVNKKDKNIKKYFEQDKIFKEKMRSFLEEYQDLNVKEVLLKLS